MDKMYQYTIGFLFGVFLLMTIIMKDSGFYFNYTSNDDSLEKFENEDKVDEKKTKKTENEQLIDSTNDVKYDDTDDINNINNINCNNNIITNFKIERLLNKNYLLLLISSYNTSDDEKIQELLWPLDNEKGSKVYDVNLKDKIPEKIKYPLNPDIYGYNLNNLTIEIDNKSSNSVDIREMTILFTLKLKSIINGNGQLININNINGNIISINIVDSKEKKCNKGDVNCENSINMQENNNIQESSLLYVNKKYNIIIDFNNHKYYIYDIGEYIFKEDSTFFGLMIGKKDITFHINNTKLTFKINNDKGEDNLYIKYPIYINKNKDCDIVLYSFALFNKSICDADMKAYKMYNNYYMYGNKT